MSAADRLMIFFLINRLTSDFHILTDSNDCFHVGIMQSQLVDYILIPYLQTASEEPLHQSIFSLVRATLWNKTRNVAAALIDCVIL